MYLFDSFGLKLAFEVTKFSQMLRDNKLVPFSKDSQNTGPLACLRLFALKLMDKVHKKLKVVHYCMEDI